MVFSLAIQYRHHTPLPFMTSPANALTYLCLESGGSKG